MDYELLLFDRLEMIKKINEKYDLLNNAYVSFSGGKDSTVLHYLLDLALHGNEIPRVFSNTGIEYNSIIEFINQLAINDKRIQIIKPTKNIKTMLEEVGYPFKSKDHSNKVCLYQNGSRGDYIKQYINSDYNESRFACPKILKYQFSEDFNLKISDKCCYELKKKPFKQWAKENNKSITLTGMRKAEGGQRTTLNCIVTKKGAVVKFHPLAVVSDDWEDWFIKKYNIKLCELYYPPFNFQRTGCKGCPYSLELYEQLEIMNKYFPNEKKQCELIWAPVYSEYRRLNYRLKNYYQPTIEDFIK